ncbi:hypothetical protein CDAR_46671 [Caerostris darwini]|uniref:Uncharacterized protein n=1 Tax=Caerostris darwini TaxID=1538125 RepID=A0AAV4U5I5_9ARAC|nr:hypothetical protein CDAR_46671 [Caerostris darwini]
MASNYQKAYDKSYSTHKEDIVLDLSFAGMLFTLIMFIILIFFEVIFTITPSDVLDSLSETWFAASVTNTILLS